MKKYRVSIMLLCVAFITSLIHFGTGFAVALSEAQTHGVDFVFQDFIFLWLKETFEGFPAELIALSIELALFAGILQLFKPYDEDTDQIKKLEENLLEHISKLEEKLLDKG